MNKLTTVMTTLLVFAFRWLLAAAAPLDLAAPVIATTFYDNKEHPSVFQAPDISDLRVAFYNHLLTTINYSPRSDRRRLTTFTALNTLLNQIQLNLPDATVSSNGLDIVISELSCTNLSIDNIQIQHSILSNTIQQVTVEVSGVQITCNFRWGYKWTIFSGSGSGEAILDASSGISISIDFISEDYEKKPPVDASLSGCNSNIQIAGLSFSGDGLGFIGQMMDWFEHLFRDRIEGELNGVVCNELGSLANTALDQLLIEFSSKIDTYLVSSSSTQDTVTSLENSFQIPAREDGTQLFLNFQDMGQYTGDWINTAIDRIDNLFGATDDFGGLAINSLIREYILDDKGFLQLNPSAFLPDGTSIMNSHDTLTETAMAMKSITLAGLDSFVGMDIFNAIGKYTLGNSLKLQYLWVQVEIEAEMKASSLSDAIIVAPNSPSVTETFTIDFTLTELDLEFSLLLGMNTKTLGSLQLGSLLDTRNILSCLLSTVEELSFSELKLRVTDIVKPKLDGFLDEGLDEIITNLANTMFDMYEAVLKLALPGFFNTFIRNMINEYAEETLVKFAGACPENNEISAERYVDWRDMFMSPAEASLAGGLGTAPYGNVISWVMDKVDSQLFATNDDGLLKLNDMLIRPLTKSQSGIEGLIHFNRTLAVLQKVNVDQDFWRAFAQNIRFQISDLRVAGIDTLREPFQFLKPRSSAAYLLENKLSLGVENQAIDVAVQLELVVGGPKSPFATDNVVDLHLGLPSIELLADLFVTVSESRFMQMPLRDVLNFNCWLSMIPQSALNIGAAIPVFDLLLVAILPTTSCVSCSNSALNDLNTIVDFLRVNSFVDTIKSRALVILSDLMQSDFTQGTIDGQLAKSASLCPHDPNFGLLTEETGTPFRATRDLVDSIIYTGIGLVQTIAILFAQKHTSVALPVPVDIKLIVPDSAHLIDLTDLSNVASWADAALAEGRRYLGAVVNTVSNVKVLGITSLLRSTVLDDNGLLTFSLADQGHGFDSSGVKLLVVNVSLVGLDSFQAFDVLNATTSNTFTNKIKLDTLGVILIMELSVGGSNEPELLTVSLMLKDIEINAGLAVAMDQVLLGSLQLGTLLRTSQIFFCILSTIHSAGLSEFVMQVGDISEFSISGFVSEETNKQIERITDSFFTDYKPMIIKALPVFTSTTIRSLLHNILQVLIDMDKGTQCPEPDNSLEGLLDFRDLLLSESKAAVLGGRGKSPYGNLFRTFYSILDKVMSALDENGMPEMNSLVSTLTERQSGVGGDIYFPGKLISQNLEISLNGLNAAIDISLMDLRVSNIDSLGAPVKLLQPIPGESSALNNSVSIGVGGNSLRTSFTLNINAKGDEVKVRNELELGISLKSMGMILEFLAEMQEYPFLHFPLKDVLVLDCWLATVVTPVLNKFGMRVDKADSSGIVFRELALAVAEASFDLNCVACSSPLLLDMASYLSSQQGVEDTTEVANNVFKYVSNLLEGSFIQSFLDKKLNEAGMKCPHSPTYMKEFNGLQFDDVDALTTRESSYGFLVAIIAIIACLIVFIIIFISSTKLLLKLRHERWLKTLNRSQLLDLEKMQNDEAEMIRDLDIRIGSLALSAEIPLFFRLIIPIAILGNVALFFFGHLSLGGSVNISGSFGGQIFDVEGFFEFSMAKSTIEMWNAGAKSLAMLIVIFSGVWPYTKQLIIFVVWFLPTTRLSSNQRGKTLHWLDVLGKWSMVDVFVLLMTLASFQLSVESPDLGFLPTGLYSINMLVVPLWGLYANMLAQLLSQISSHIIIHYHRKTIDAAKCRQDDEWGASRLFDDAISPTATALKQHSFMLDYEALTERAQVRKCTSWLFATLLVLFVLLVICGCSLPSFSIETFGIVGLAIESGQQFREAKTSYSVFDLAQMIMAEARYLNSASDLVGLGTLASLLVVTVFVTPLTQAVSLFGQWFLPTNINQRRENMVANEILSAWQYMEVYVLSIVVSAWQLGGVSEFMINAYCSPLQSTLNALSYTGVLKQEDAQCFRVDATVEVASWLLVAASSVLWLISHFVCSASMQKVQDEILPTERRLHSDRWLHKSEQQLVTSESETMDVTMNASMDDSEERPDESLERKIKITPVPPRFTDYYFFGTIITTSNKQAVAKKEIVVQLQNGNIDARN